MMEATPWASWTSSDPSARSSYEKRWCRFRLSFVLLAIITLTFGWHDANGFSTAPLPANIHSTLSSSVSERHGHIGLTTQQYAKAVKLSNEPWFPLPSSSIESEEYDEEQYQIEVQAIQLAAHLVKQRLAEKKQDNPDSLLEPNVINDASKSRYKSPRVEALLENRFMDLACTEKGERSLENLFVGQEVENEPNDNILRATIMVFQSLCVFGMQMGVKGQPEQLRRMVSHLDPRRNPSLIERDLIHKWDSDSVRRLKYQLQREAAVQLLSELKWKRTTQGAKDLLVAMGVWEPHEDLALLRSGFPLRFSKEESVAAKQAFNATQYTVDPEQLLGIRKDLRHLKVFTIDGASTMEIDDGLSVEKITDDNSRGQDDRTTRYRIWIHIADADRYSPPGSDLFRTAGKRITSLYLPGRSFSMFPPIVGNELMSLSTNNDCFALSLSVEVNSDGSIDESSIEMVPSVIRVTYRLSYDEVDEMLEEGTGYAEEWELGVLLGVANCRRQYRIRNGSSEGILPNPIPYSSVVTFADKSASGGVGISIKVEVSHNAGRNQTLENGMATPGNNRRLDNTVPASSSFLLVTEAMIMAGEALGRWKRIEHESSGKVPNCLRLPFRSQPGPDFLSRSSEKNVMEDLFELNVGDGLCYSWYIRRFLQPVKVTETMLPHSGLGLEAYVQWTSPIRRYGDLQVHSKVKRFLRRKKVNELLETGSPIPPQITAEHLGLPSKMCVDAKPSEVVEATDQMDSDINFSEGAGLMGAARTLQRQSQQYWLFEYISRLFKNDPDVTFEAVVLGCVDSEKHQYAIYVYDLGLEHRYLALGPLDPGIRMHLKIQKVHPRNNLLTFVRVS